MKYCPKCGSPIIEEEWPGGMGKIVRCIKGDYVQTFDWTHHTI